MSISCYLVLIIYDRIKSKDVPCLFIGKKRLAEFKTWTMQFQFSFALSPLGKAYIYVSNLFATGRIWHKVT